MTLDATELASIRATVAEWWTTTCSVTRPSGAQSDDGWQTGATTTVASGVSCRVDPEPSRRREAVGADGIVAYAEWNVTVPYDTAEIKPQDTITTAAEGTFRVVSTTGQRSEQLNVVARCVKVDP